MIKSSKLTLDTSRHHHHESEEEDEEVILSQPATIFDAQTIDETVPPGFDAVKIAIEGGIAHDLSWTQAHQIAEARIKQGLRIFWEIDLGLFANLKRSLDNKSQFLSLSLSLEHFRDTLWKKFKSDSIGLNLYRGSADFSRNFIWDDVQRANLQDWLATVFNIGQFCDETGISIAFFKEANEHLLTQSAAGKYLLSLFCRNAAGEYLGLLRGCLPDTMTCFVLLDNDGIHDPYQMAQLCNKECFQHFCIGMTGKGNLGGELGWKDSILKAGSISRELLTCMPLSSACVGVCLPLVVRCFPSDREKLGKVIGMLQEKKMAFRIISEAFLTTEWDGLDYLIVQSDALSAQGRRKLQGFCAAGGVVVYVGSPLGLPGEIPIGQKFGSMN